MQILSIVSLLIATAFTGAFKPTAWKANQLLRMSTSGKDGAFLKFTSSKVKAAAAVGLLFAGGLIASPVTPAWAAPVSGQSGPFKKILLPNGVLFDIGTFADPNARLEYTCSDNVGTHANVYVTTSIAEARALVTPSITTCKSSEVRVSLKNPINGKQTQFLAISTPGNWVTVNDGQGGWTITRASP